jgi:hypothetical protein
VPHVAKSLGLVGLLCIFAVTIGYYGAKAWVKAWSEVVEALY